MDMELKMLVVVWLKTKLIVENGDDAEGGALGRDDRCDDDDRVGGIRDDGGRGSDDGGTCFAVDVNEDCDGFGGIENGGVNKRRPSVGVLFEDGNCCW